MRYRTSQGISPVLFIIIACSAIFIAGIFNSRIDSFLWMVPSQWESRPWTLLTNLFVHAGFGHILTNMFTLYFFGTYVLSLVGERRFLLIYFAAGLAGNILYLLLFPIPFIPVVGASGAIFGLGGVLTVLRPKIRVFIFPIPAPIPLWGAVIGGFVLLSFVPGVAWEAHLGGLLLGLGVGLYLRRRGY